MPSAWVSIGGVWVGGRNPWTMVWRGSVLRRRVEVTSVGRGLEEGGGAQLVCLGEGLGYITHYLFRLDHFQHLTHIFDQIIWLM